MLYIFRIPLYIPCAGKVTHSKPSKHLADRHCRRAHLASGASMAPPKPIPFSINERICLHLVFCPIQVGLAVVERAVAAHARYGKWQGMSARGARNRRHAITNTR